MPGTRRSQRGRSPDVVNDEDSIATRRPRRSATKSPSKTLSNGRSKQAANANGTKATARTRSRFPRRAVVVASPSTSNASQKSAGSRKRGRPKSKVASSSSSKVSSRKTPKRTRSAIVDDADTDASDLDQEGSQDDEIDSQHDDDDSQDDDVDSQDVEDESQDDGDAINSQDSDDDQSDVDIEQLEIEKEKLKHLLSIRGASVSNKVSHPVSFPETSTTHWDYVLKEMAWMANDFKQERKWKEKTAKKVARDAKKGIQRRANMWKQQQRNEQLKLRKIAVGLAKGVKKFWEKIDRIVVFKHSSKNQASQRTEMDKQLDFLVGQTERYANMLAQKLTVAQPVPRLPSPSSQAQNVDSSGEGSLRRKAWSNDESSQAFTSEDSDLDSRNDDEWDGESLQDDEATLVEAEVDEGDTNEETMLLKQDAELSREELIAKYGAPDSSSHADHERVAGTATASSERSDVLSDEDEYENSSIGLDDETTLMEQELEDNQDDVEAEMNALKEDAALTREQLIAKYGAPPGGGAPAQATTGNITGPKSARSALTVLEDEMDDSAEGDDWENDSIGVDDETTLMEQELEDNQDDVEAEMNALKEDAALTREQLIAKYGAPPGGNVVADAEPGSSADAEPGSSADAEPGSSADAEPGSSADAQPGSSADAEPGSSADAEPGSSADGNVEPSSIADGARSGSNNIVAASAATQSSDVVSSDNDSDDLRSVGDDWRSDDELEVDDETTLELEDANSNSHDVAEELKQLEQDTKLSHEELVAKYGPASQENKEVPSSTLTTTEEASGHLSPTSVNCENKMEIETNITELTESIENDGHVVPSPFLMTKSVTLRAYQRAGLDWLVSLYERKLNGILADEMGLGKTIQTIALLAHLAGTEGVWGPHLIVVPTSVLLNWEMEIKRFCPGFKVITYYGSIKERKIRRQGWSKPNAFHICITSYQLAVQDAQVFKRKKWVYMILDEAHNIKNFQSQRWQTLLNFNTKRRLLLTGTPLQNSLMELWSLMHFLMPHIFQSQQEFKYWFSNPLNQIVEEKPGMQKDQSSENNAVVQRLHSVIRPFLLRRLKVDVAKQLPKKYEHIVMVDLSKRQQYLYEDFISRSSTKNTISTGGYLGMMSVLMKLRMVCNHPDIFEPRLVSSSFIMEPIDLLVPLRVLRAGEPLCDVDHGTSVGDYLLGGGLGRDLLMSKVGKANGERITELAAPREGLIQEIVSESQKQVDRELKECKQSNKHFAHLMKTNTDFARRNRQQRAQIAQHAKLAAVSIANLNDVRCTATPQTKPCFGYDVYQAVAVPGSLCRYEVFEYEWTTPKVAQLSTPHLAKGSPISAANEPMTVNNTETQSGSLQSVPAPKSSAVQCKNIDDVPLEQPVAQQPEVAPKPKLQSSKGVPTFSSISTESFNNTIVQQPKVKLQSSKGLPALSPSDVVVQKPKVKLQSAKGFATTSSVNALNVDAQTPSTIQQTTTSMQLPQSASAPQLTSVALKAAHPSVEKTQVAEASELSEASATSTPQLGHSTTMEQTKTPVLHQSTTPSFATSQAGAQQELSQTRMNSLHGITPSVATPTTTHSVMTMKMPGTSLPLPNMSHAASIASNGMTKAVTSSSNKDEQVPSVSQHMPKKTEKSSQDVATIETPSWVQVSHKVVDDAFSNRLTKSNALPASRAIHSVRGWIEYLTPMIHRFVFLTPKARSPGPTVQLRGRDVYVSKAQEEQEGEKIIEDALALKQPTSLEVYHPIAIRQQLSFPDRMLVQYDCGKLQVLATMLHDLKRKGHRVLIFTQMTKMLDILEVFLNIHGHVYFRLDGATKVDDRQMMMERFNRDDKIFAFILSTRSGGLGINLVGADTVIFYDSDWNPSMDAQAQDRAHRIGQTRDVHIYRLVTRHSIEENILKKANQKRHLNKLTVEDGKFRVDAFVKSAKQVHSLLLGEEKAIANAEEAETQREQPGSVADDDDGSDEGEVSAMEVTRAMAAVEDDSDKEAAENLQREVQDELNVFDESVDLRAEGTDPGTKKGKLTKGSKNTKHNQEAASSKGSADPLVITKEQYMSLEAQLRPVEKYAIDFRTNHQLPSSVSSGAVGASETPTRVAADKAQDWNIDSLEQIKEQMENEGDEELIMAARDRKLRAVRSSHEYDRVRRSVLLARKLRKLSGDAWVPEQEEGTKRLYYRNIDTHETTYEVPLVKEFQPVFVKAKKEKWNGMHEDLMVYMLQFMPITSQRIAMGRTSWRWYAASRSIHLAIWVEPSIPLIPLTLQRKEKEQDSFGLITDVAHDTKEQIEVDDVTANLVTDSADSEWYTIGSNVEYLDTKDDLWSPGVVTEILYDGRVTVTPTVRSGHTTATLTLLRNQIRHDTGVRYTWVRLPEGVEYGLCNKTLRSRFACGVKKPLPRRFTSLELALEQAQPGSTIVLGFGFHTLEKPVRISGSQSRFRIIGAKNALEQSRVFSGIPNNASSGLDGFKSPRSNRKELQLFKQQITKFAGKAAANCVNQRSILIAKGSLQVEKQACVFFEGVALVRSIEPGAVKATRERKVKGSIHAVVTVLSASKSRSMEYAQTGTIVVRNHGRLLATDWAVVGSKKERAPIVQVRRFGTLIGDSCSISYGGSFGVCLTTGATCILSRSKVTHNGQSGLLVLDGLVRLDRMKFHSNRGFGVQTLPYLSMETIQCDFKSNTLGDIGTEYAGYSAALHPESHPFVPRLPRIPQKIEMMVKNQTQGLQNQLTSSIQQVSSVATDVTHHPHLSSLSSLPIVQIPDTGVQRSGNGKATQLNQISGHPNDQFYRTRVDTTMLVGTGSNLLPIHQSAASIQANFQENYERRLQVRELHKTILVSVADVLSEVVEQVVKVERGRLFREVHGALLSPTSRKPVNPSIWYKYVLGWKSVKGHETILNHALQHFAPSAATVDVLLGDEQASKGTVKKPTRPTSAKSSTSGRSRGRKKSFKKETRTKNATATLQSTNQEGSTIERQDRQTAAPQLGRKRQRRTEATVEPGQVAVKRARGKRVVRKPSSLLRGTVHPGGSCAQHK